MVRSITITQERPDHPDAISLMRALDAHLEPLYPSKSRHGFSIEKLMTDNVPFFVLRVDGAPAACAGVKLFGAEFGEIKRMYARPAFRGMGLGERMLAHLEDFTRAQGIRFLRLETGIHQYAAIRLYERAGFKRIPPFPPYFEDPVSMCYEKFLEEITMTPEERARRIESFGAAHPRLVAALARFPREMWAYRPTPDRWTIREIVVHITDSEANSFIRCRRLIAEPGSPVLGYDEAQWASALGYGTQSADDALELFKWLRLTTWKLIRHLPAATWAHTIVHSENGVMTMDDWLDVYERHIPEHIAQMDLVHADWLKR